MRVGPWGRGGLAEEYQRGVTGLNWCAGKGDAVGTLWARRQPQETGVRQETAMGARYTAPLYTGKHLGKMLMIQEQVTEPSAGICKRIKRSRQTGADIRIHSQREHQV